MERGKALPCLHYYMFLELSPQDNYGIGSGLIDMYTCTCIHVHVFYPIVHCCALDVCICLALLFFCVHVHEHEHSSCKGMF